MSLQAFRQHAAEQSGGTSAAGIKRLVLRLLAGVPQVRSLLDFGAGKGELLAQLHALNTIPTLAGVDLFPRPVDLPANIYWQQADLNEVVRLPQQYDAVVCSETIEHLENPRQVFRSLADCLAPGGTLILTMPNQECLRSYVGLLFGGHFTSFLGACYPAHITALLRLDLVRLCAETGLAPPTFAYTNHGGIPKLPRVAWQSISFGFLRGRLFSDNVGMTTQGWISVLHRLWKPWYVWRPSQLWRRWWQAKPQPGYQPLPVAWGASIHADPTKAIGQSILSTGLYDLAVSEVLARLITPGDTVIDAGANIGYMSVLMATCGAGQVLAFEPHPELFGIFAHNTARLPAVRAQQVALGAVAGTAQLALPSNFADNDGLARIVTESATEPTVSVQMTTLDAELPTATATVMKIDVEGHELPVLHGATRAIAEQRIRHIVYEDHVGPTSDVTAQLRLAGYIIFALGWTMRGPLVVPADGRRIATLYEAPSYLATLVPDEAQARCAPRGWRVLRQMDGRVASK